jgi:hypothetical protein
MRTLYMVAFMLLLTGTVTSSQAQNIGIGETNPAAKLEVKGPVNPLFNSFLVKDGNNIPLFSVNNMGYTGINLSDPAAPLHVYSSTASEMIRIRGVNPYLSFFDETDTYRGYLWYRVSSMELGSSSGSNLPVTIAPNNTVTTTFLPNGNTGFGVADPFYRLDINGRIRLRHRSESAGIWFNNSSNIHSPGFVGMQNDNAIGFYGSQGANWGLLMSTISGCIGINTIPTNARLAIQGVGYWDNALRIDNGKTVYAGAGINTATPVFVHKPTTANTRSDLGYTVIDNPFCNSDPSAILIVTLNGTYGSGGTLPGYGTIPEIPAPAPPLQILSTTSFLVFFNGPNSDTYFSSPAFAKDKWCIKTYSGNYVSDPLNFNFNVMIVHPN